jgi:hypothetical protein
MDCLQGQGSCLQARLQCTAEKGRPDQELASLRASAAAAPGHHSAVGVNPVYKSVFTFGGLGNLPRMCYIFSSGNKKY